MMADSPDLDIRLRRTAFNRALADRDTVTIGALLAPAAILITGTDSTLISGRKAQILVWKREFTAPSRTLYTRTPKTILVSRVEPIALENGEWRGVTAASDMLLASGVYTAKWRKLGAEWMIEAEIYLTTG